MKIPIDLPDAQAERLRGEASRLGVKLEDLATAAVIDLVSRSDGEFDQAAEHVLRKNEELYKRLS